jgi:hypothetical protein
MPKIMDSKFIIAQRLLKRARYIDSLPVIDKFVRAEIIAEKNRIVKEAVEIGFSRKDFVKYIKGNLSQQNEPCRLKKVKNFYV